MIIKGRVVAKLLQEGNLSFARIKVGSRKNKGNNDGRRLCFFDIADQHELNIGDQVQIEVTRIAQPGTLLAEGLIAEILAPNIASDSFVRSQTTPGCLYHSAPELLESVHNVQAFATDFDEEPIFPVIKIQGCESGRFPSDRPNLANKPEVDRG